MASLAGAAGVAGDAVPMVFTVSTVKDTLANVRRFVADNLAGGVDHMVIMLDAPDPEVETWLDAHPHVTAVVADTSWWGDERPEDLNDRQRYHANIVRALLTTVEEATWLFHIDGDEVVQIDRARFDELPQTTQAVRLRPLEAVSQPRWEERPTWFKRLLGKDDLHLLEVLGVLSKAANGVYFHGHVEGKVGMRPSLDRWLTLHRVVDAGREPVEAREARWLRLLHYESYCGEDFVRKWSTILDAGPMVSLRPVRERTARAVHALLTKPLDPAQREAYLMRIFEQTTQDDLQTLRDLGLLVQVDPTQGTHVPAPLANHARDHLAGMLRELAVHAKAPFDVCAPAGPVRAVLDELGAGPVGSTAGAETVRAGWFGRRRDRGQ